MLRFIRRLLLRLALGNRTYRYMTRSVLQDPRTYRARSVDIVVRKDAFERRIEADWVRDIARLVRDPNHMPSSENSTALQDRFNQRA